MKKRAVVSGLAAGLAAAALLSLSVGSARMSFGALWNALTGKNGYETERLILLSLRLPRLLAAVIAGAGLAVSGVLLQCAVNNPLAGPNIIGVNAGAGLGVVVCLAAWPGAVRFLPLSAFAGAFLTTLLILFLAGKAGQSRTTVILAGVACTALFQAGVSFVSALDSDILSIYGDFSVGSLYGVRSGQLVLPALLVALCLTVSLCLSGRMTVMTLGDGVAASLGVRPKILRALMLMMASLSAGAVVSYAGLLGFVGLIVPHIARKLTGENLRAQTAVSALAGALLVTLSDLAGRTLFAPSEIPVGIVTAFVGAPFFIALLLKRGGGLRA